MINKVADIEKKMKEFILKAYNLGYSPKNIEKILGISHNTMITFLAKEGLFLTRDEYPSFKVDGEKMLIIADTHIGSRSENLNYIDMAYDKGLQEGVCACLHAGDIIQGEYDRTNKSLAYQLDVLDKEYPEVNEFNTYLLLGNHDYSVFENNSDAKKLLENKKGLITLGYKKAYFDWNDYLYAMEHKVKQLSDEMPIEDLGLSFIGHGHELKIKSQSKLKIPTLSDDIINKENGAYPAFLIASLVDDQLEVDVYHFKKNCVKLRKRNYFTKDMLDVYKVKW